MTAQRLRRSADVRSVLSEGRRVHGKAAVLHVQHRGDRAPARWTVVAGRKVGGAVERNRAKRRLRAVLRAAALPAGCDVVAVARRAAVTMGFPALVTEITALLARSAAGVRA